MQKIPVTIADAVDHAAKRLQAADLTYFHGTDNALDEAKYLAFHACCLAYPIADVELDLPIADGAYEKLLRLTDERIEKRLPAAYLTGVAYFAGFAFDVTTDVMIPRSAFSELIEFGYTPWADDFDSVLDLCSGSGCLAIATALHYPHCEVDAIELSDGALGVARANVEKYKLSDRVNVLHSDLFTAVKGKTYDLIVSNPPYVSTAEYKSLAKEFFAEPKMAFVADDDGLAIVDQILRAAAQYLNEAGALIVEVGSAAAAVEKKYAGLPLTWLDLSAQGIFAVRRQELIAYWNKH